MNRSSSLVPEHMVPLDVMKLSVVRSTSLKACCILGSFFAARIFHCSFDRVFVLRRFGFSVMSDVGLLHDDEKHEEIEEPIHNITILQCYCYSSSSSSSSSSHQSKQPNPGSFIAAYYESPRNIG